MTRRARGESSISKGADGRWHGYVSMGLKDGGQRDRRHVAADKRAEVVRRVHELEEQREDGIVLADGRALSVGQWLTLWLDTIAARRVRPSTLVGYRTCVKRIDTQLGHHRLDRLQPEHLERFYRQLDQEGLSPTTVLLHHRVLSRALKVAMQRGRVARNVATLVDAPTPRRDEVEPLTKAEARLLLEAARHLPNGARWSVALALGLRQGETLGLLWDAIDLDAGTLTVRWALQRQTGKDLVLVPPKSKAGRRTIKLPDPLRDALRQHRAQQAEQRLAAGSLWEDGGFVFCQPNGWPLDARRDWQAWKDLLRSAGVRDARLHDARAHRRDPAAAAGSPRAGRDADPGSLPDPAHLGHLLACRTGTGAGSSGPDGRRAMELTGTQTGTHGELMRRSESQEHRSELLPRLDLNQEPCD